MGSEPRVITATRLVQAPAARVFAHLADPGHHRALDTSGMIRGAAAPGPITHAGQVFVMNMHNALKGDHQVANHVVTFEPDRALGWAPAEPGHPPAGHTWTWRLEPAGDWAGGSRFTWRKAASVEISGTRFPARTAFGEVRIKKKSFCGSFSNDKPCLHIDFAKFRDANKAVVQSLLGSRYLTLNNSVQDPSYLRQLLGYALFELAGLPFSRGNFARVLVNGTPIGQGVAGVDSPGVFVNVEPTSSARGSR